MSGTVTNLSSLLLLGLFLGMRHATDADHVIAIATIVSRQRSLRGSALIGAAWGIGHTLTILVVGGAIILFGIVIPTRMGLAMELAVGVMLVLLGVLTLTGFGRTLGAPPRRPRAAPTRATTMGSAATPMPMPTATTSTATPTVTAPATMAIRRTARRSSGWIAAWAACRSTSGCGRW